jgi:cytochrome c-type biogenesis protein CcmH/NrfG
VDTSVERTQRTYIKIILGLVVGFVLFVFLCWGGCHLYSVVESQHVTRRAAAYLGGGDLRQAAISARRALQLNPKSVEAMRLMAQVAETSRDHSAMDWRRRALELDPRSSEDALALAACALQFNEIDTAREALKNLDDAARAKAGFHVVAAQLAEAEKKPAETESHWTQALELDPQNKSYQLQFGIALLRMNDRAKRESGRKMLEELRSDEKQRAPATRALVVDGAASHIDGDALARLARELQEYPEATFSDRMLYLDILRQLRDPKFVQYLTDIEKVAVAKASDLATLLSWMKNSGQSLLAVDFSKSLPAETISPWPVPLALAEAYAKVADWNGLEAIIKGKKWGEFDFLRHGYLALAMRGQDKPAAADHEWAAAQKEAGNQPQYLSALARAVAEWGWQKETIELLWTLTKYPQTQAEALQELYLRCADAGDTLGLYRVLGRLAELHPDDLRIQNNLAQVSLLLNADVERARKLAADLYQKEGSNPAYVSTYAFALFTKGDVAGALRVMKSIPEAQLRNDASLAAYYGVVLAAAGDTASAGEYLTLGSTAKLLPEEKALVAKAQSSVK